MYGREQRVLLRHYLERGLTKAEVARELGVSRRTFAPRKSHPGASMSKQIEIRRHVWSVLSVAVPQPAGWRARAIKSSR